MPTPAYVIIAEFDNDSLPMVLVASQSLTNLKGWMRNKPMKDGESRRTLWKDHNDSVMFDPGGHRLIHRLTADPDVELLGTVYEKS